MASPPYFAAYTLWALFLGWSLGAFLRHRVMLWVWVLPAALLGYMYFRFPHCPANFFPAAGKESRSANDLCFGRPCTPVAPCLYQLWFTFPFFASAAYSLGAWIAEKRSGMRDYAETMMHIRVARASLVGAACIVLQLIVGWRQALHLFASLIGQAKLFFLFEIMLLFGIPTYVLAVAVGLAGRRFAITRWFLDEPAPTKAPEPST